MATKRIVYPDGSREWQLISSGKTHRGNGLPAFIYTNGNRVWYNFGNIHRKHDKPAVIDASGDQMWCINGKAHREKGPAFIQANGNQEWWLNGKLHRVGGLPAVIHHTKNGGCHQAWWVDGKRHRVDDLPAVISTQGGGGQEGGGDQEWWENGLLHRLNGPAIIKNDKVEYYHNGVKIKEEPYDAEIHEKYRFKSGSKTKAAPRDSA